MGVMQRIFAAIWRPGPVSGWQNLGPVTIPTSAGVDIDADRALTVVTYYACLRALAEDIGKLPLKVYKKLKPKGKEEDTGHPLYGLLHTRANQHMSAQAFRETLTHWAAGWGNGYAEIVYGNGDGNPPSELWPIHPNRVTMHRDESSTLFYRIQNDGGGHVDIDHDRILHIHGMGDDGYGGYSVCTFAANTLGAAKAGELFAARFFGNSAVPSMAIVAKSPLDQNAMDNIRRSWATRQGGDGQRGTAVVPFDATLQQLTIPNEESQFLETRQFNRREICSWFRMPPHKIGDLGDAHYNNIEHQGTEYVVDTLMPWLVRWETEIAVKLLSDPDYCAEHVVQALMRGDSQARSAFYTAMQRNGSMCVNEIRELENMNPIEGGEVHFITLDLGRLDLAGKEPDEMDETDTAAEDDGMGNGQEDLDGNAGETTRTLGPESRDAVKTASCRVLAASADRVIAKEVKAADRAARRNAGNPAAFGRWVSEWFSESLAKQVDECLRPGAESMLQLLGAIAGLEPGEWIVEAVDSCLRPIVDDHCRAGAAQMRAAFDNRWEDSLAEWMAAEPPRLALLVTEAADAAMEECHVVL